MNDFISFPGLGINDLPISSEAFTIPIGDGFTIYWYGIIIGLGFALAMIYAFKRSSYFKIDSDRMIDVILVSAVAAIIGARLYYIMFSPELRAAFFENPMMFFDTRNGGLGIYGGIIFAFIAALVMCKLRKVNVLAMFDLASLGLLIGQGIGRWGNFFNQEAFGTNTTLPWGMTGSIIQKGLQGGGYDPALPVHPTFLYESLWCLLGLVLLHVVSKKMYKFRGQIFSLYIVWYGAGRAVIEGFRTDSLYIGQIRISQLVAVLSVIGGIILYLVLKARFNRSPVDLFAEDDEPTLEEELEEEIEAAEEKEENIAENIEFEALKNSDIEEDLELEKKTEADKSEKIIDGILEEVASEKKSDLEKKTEEKVKTEKEGVIEDE